MRVLVIFLPKTFPNKCLHFKKFGLWVIFQSSSKEKSHENNLNTSPPIITSPHNNQKDNLYKSESTSPIKSNSSSSSISNPSSVSSGSAYSYNGSSGSGVNSITPPPIVHPPTKKKRSWRIRTPSPKPKSESTLNSHRHHHQYHHNNNFSDLSVQLPPTPTYPEKPLFLSNSNHIPKPRSRHSYTNSLDNSKPTPNKYQNNSNNIPHQNSQFSSKINYNNNNNNYNSNYNNISSSSSVSSTSSSTTSMSKRRQTPSPNKLINSSQTTISQISNSSLNSMNSSHTNLVDIANNNIVSTFTNESPCYTNIIRPIPIKSSNNNIQPQNSLNASQSLLDNNTFYTSSSSSSSSLGCNTAIEDIPLVPVLSSSHSNIKYSSDNLDFITDNKTIFNSSNGLINNSINNGIQSPLPHQISINSKDDLDENEDKLQNWNVINIPGTQMCRDQITINPFEKSTKEIY
ncbi:hypothetical protein DICPUDRAFT_85584 [Dictyostelium purpureum]|uniref:Uncharacterized protein n=1 Tax=Dictyostelium purpureum TaxID=5786 RepID=F1A668_DICPU|nr:uncharacterized protein DICPUDRAFT_85584 [Dictyostelium purpureum]EGC28313.1 hypothetical protein DICPUDRAFT_85584 [Dictyostelium purpureum]|eukprot:XP_003295162.1 hypothetical protein DICPUDRAFT_85584 [Dictyostelium purpureum]